MNEFLVNFFCVAIAFFCNVGDIDSPGAQQPRAYNQPVQWSKQ